MEPSSNQLALLKDIVDRISVGVFVVNKQNELVLWNGYMENYSQTSSEEVVGKNIFESFPELPKNWLEQKIHNVFVIKNFSFTSWEHRPYLFKFLHNRPITGGIDYMRQNCTFLPMKGDSGDIEYVCITLFDVTDTSIYESMLKNAVRSLAEASNRDGLTNVYNRRYLETIMSKEFARIKRYGGTMSFIIVDLDHFKAVNDTYGHLAGDEILKIAAKRCGEGLRTADTLCRYGGEEFAVMLPETPVDGAAILAQRLCDHLADGAVTFGDNSINISASLGVAEFQGDMESHEEIISHADDMLYRSKENGRNQVTVYYPDKELANTAEENAEVNPENEATTSDETSTDIETISEIDASAMPVDVESTSEDINQLTDDLTSEVELEEIETSPEPEENNVEVAQSTDEETSAASESVNAEDTTLTEETVVEDSVDLNEEIAAQDPSEEETSSEITEVTDELDDSEESLVVAEDDVEIESATTESPEQVETVEVESQSEIQIEEVHLELTPEVETNDETAIENIESTDIQPLDTPAAETEEIDIDLKATLEMEAALAASPEEVEQTELPEEVEDQPESMEIETQAEPQIAVAAQTITDIDTGIGTDETEVDATSAIVEINNQPEHAAQENAQPANVDHVDEDLANVEIEEEKTIYVTIGSK